MWPDKPRLKARFVVLSQKSSFPSLPFALASCLLNTRVAAFLDHCCDPTHAPCPPTRLLPTLAVRRRFVAVHIDSTNPPNSGSCFIRVQWLARFREPQFVWTRTVRHDKLATQRTRNRELPALHNETRVPTSELAEIGALRTTFSILRSPASGNQTQSYPQKNAGPPRSTRCP